jgi:5'-nucleotidase
MNKPQILLTNDDGILSPGLRAAAETLSAIGYVHVAAPRNQFSGAGRCLTSISDGVIDVKDMRVNGNIWKVFAVGGTPAQVVQHGSLEILPNKPNLVVSGINYGENLGTGITASGTVGAALEAAELGIPAIAVSLETEPHHHLSYSEEVDFSVAAYFCTYFSKLFLEKKFPRDVKVLKVDIPCDATETTPWEITRLSHSRYFVPTKPDRISWKEPADFGYHIEGNPERTLQDSDVYAVRVKRVVSVTPLSVDLTSRVNLKELENLLRS